MMINVGQYPQGSGNVPMMQMGQQPTVAPMLMNHYAPNQQPEGTFDKQGQVAIN